MSHATWLGYIRFYNLLRRGGGDKWVYRLYRDDGLSFRLKNPGRNVSAANGDQQPAAAAINEMWSMDFVSDALFNGWRVWAPTVVDAFMREALTINVDEGIKGEQGVPGDGPSRVDPWEPCLEGGSIAIAT